MKPPLGVAAIEISQETAAPDAIVALFGVEQARRLPGSQMAIKCLTGVVGALVPAVREKEQLLLAWERSEISLKIVHEIRTTKDQDSGGI
ncbi:hypothetical protein ACFIOY_35085 [Bradyrhizobium sp. TZ2]